MSQPVGDTEQSIAAERHHGEWLIGGPKHQCFISRKHGCSGRVCWGQLTASSGDAIGWQSGGKSGWETERDFVDSECRRFSSRKFWEDWRANVCHCRQHLTGNKFRKQP